MLFCVGVSLSFQTFLEKALPIILPNQVSGIGPHLAHEFVYTDGIMTIQDLWKIKAKLNNNQLIGLKYYEEFQERIPNEEVKLVVEKVQKVAKEINPKLEAICCGSFRREKATW